MCLYLIPVLSIYAGKSKYFHIQLVTHILPCLRSLNYYTKLSAFGQRTDLACCSSVGQLGGSGNWVRSCQDCHKDHTWFMWQTLCSPRLLCGVLKRPSQEMMHVVYVDSSSARAARDVIIDLIVPIRYARNVIMDAKIALTAINPSIKRRGSTRLRPQKAELLGYK